MTIQPETGTSCLSNNVLSKNVLSKKMYVSPKLEQFGSILGLTAGGSNQITVEGANDTSNLRNRPV